MINHRGFQVRSAVGALGLGRFAASDDACSPSRSLGKEILDALGMRGGHERAELGLFVEGIPKAYLFGPAGQSVGELLGDRFVHDET